MIVSGKPGGCHMLHFPGVVPQTMASVTWGHLSQQVVFSTSLPASLLMLCSRIFQGHSAFRHGLSFAWFMYVCAQLERVLWEKVLHTGQKQNAIMWCLIIIISFVCVCVCVFWQAWADAFRSSPDLTGVVHIYEELKRKGIEFPMADLDALSPIHTPQRVRRNE